MKIYVRKGLKINLWIILVRKLHLLKDILNVSRICMRSACLAHCFWGYLLHSTMSWFNLLFVCLICILWPETLARFVPVYITHRNIYNISMESCVLYAIWSAITAAICAESAFRIIIGKNKKNPLKKKDTRSQVPTQPTENWKPHTRAVEKRGNGIDCECELSKLSIFDVC